MFNNVFDGAKSVSIRKVIERISGVSLSNSRYGGNISCPLGRHDDAKPSFHIYDSTNSFHCFSCGCSGSVIDYYIMATGLVDSKENAAFAAEQICKEFGIEYQDNYVKDPEYDNYTQVYNWVAGFFVRCNKYDNALDYWKSRKLDTLVNEYGLGYCPAVFRDKTNTVVTFKHILIQKFPHIPVATLDTYNLYDMYGQCVFSERYMFAIHNSKGDVIAFSGRTAVDDPAKYKNSKETRYFQKKKVLYNFHKAKNYPAIYVVEGQADALSLVASGVPNVVASLGTAFTTEHIELLKGKDIILAFDNDDAGHTQMLKLLTENPQKKLYVQDIFFGLYKDFNEALCSMFDLKSYLTNSGKMYGPDYLLKLFCTNATKLNRLKSDKDKDGNIKPLEVSVTDLEEYEKLHKKDIYLDFSELDDRVKVHEIVSKASKFYHPVAKDNFAIRLQRLIKGKRSK